MAILTIGRVGLDVELGHPSEWEDVRRIDGREFTIRGFVRSTTAELAKALRTELLEQQGQLVSVTYTLDPVFDGYYILADSRLSSVPMSYRAGGLFPFELILYRIGSTSRTQLQSNITGTVLTNAHGLLEAEVRPTLSPPIGHLAFNWPLLTAWSAISRTAVDGTITAYVSTGEFDIDASWGCDPDDYYKGAVKLTVGGRVRAGLDVPNLPVDWVVDNGLIRVRPEDSGGSTGRILVSSWSGSVWESEKDFGFLWNASLMIPYYTHIAVTRNTPETVSLRLIGGDEGRQTVDLTIRRGQPFIIGVWSWNGSAVSLKVLRDTNEASSTLTPTGASSAVGVRATSNDADGNRFVLYTPQAHTADTTAGGVSVAATTVLKFCIGMEINGTGASSGNTGNDLALQYFGYVSENVRAVWR